MSFSIVYTQEFEKEIKRLSKKYPSIKKDFSLLLSSLQINPLQGTSLGKNIYKIRLAVSSKSAGKSGGARVITYARVINNEVVLISIYDKSEKETISDAEIKLRLNKYLQ